MTSFPSTLAIAGIGTTEIIIILFIVLLLFGAKKLPELARGLGKSMNEFKKASNEMEREMNADPNSATPAKPLPEKRGEPVNPPHGSN
ncbi:MAG TPA: twin-arginine translocase TatA/TatE family subunit [Candidatus Synoicihabitans sp.]|nr:twin-arginine translocase TatA/TatE family subunit [Candidatus Synoicihabitans sp.]